MKFNLVATLFVLGIFFGSFFLQWWLSKRENKILGLILPILSFGVSLLPLFAMPAFESVRGEGKEMIPGALVSMIITFLLFNIPTIIHSMIYYIARQEIRRKKAMEKMHIQDL